MVKEIRYPSESEEMRFHLWSVNGGDLGIDLILGSMQDLERFTQEYDELCSNYELIINFEEMTITIHDWYLY